MVSQSVSFFLSTIIIWRLELLELYVLPYARHHTTGILTPLSGSLFTHLTMSPHGHVHIVGPNVA